VSGDPNPPELASAADVPSNAYRLRSNDHTGGGRDPFVETLDGSMFRKVGKGYANLRDAAGEDIDIAMHCTGQFDTRSAIGLCKAIECMPRRASGRHQPFTDFPANAAIHAIPIHSCQMCPIRNRISTINRTSPSPTRVVAPASAIGPCRHHCKF
jgi:hypothetical protein